MKPPRSEGGAAAPSGGIFRTGTNRRDPTNIDAETEAMATYGQIDNPTMMRPSRRTFWLRLAFTLIGVILLIAGIVGVKAMFIMKQMASVKPPPPPTVTTTVAKAQEWSNRLETVGSLRAWRGTDVSTEVAGLVRSARFRSGQNVAEGEVLVELNAEAERAQLGSLEAAAKLARATVKRDGAVRGSGRQQGQLDKDAADLESKKAQVAEQAAIVAKKGIRAAFAGKLGISTVNPGQYINPGDKLVTLQTIDPIYVDFFLPQQEVPKIAIGQPVILVSNAWRDVEFDGKITAINPKVDADTRNVQVEATVPNPKRRLLPGMFATVDVIAGPERRYLTLPQTAITYNPYGATVFVVKRAAEAKGGAGGGKAKPALVAQQVFVTTGPTRGDQVAVLSGVDPGVEVVSSGQVKLKNGTPLIVDNAVQPANSPNPDSAGELRGRGRR